MQLWPPLDGIHKENWENLMEILQEEETSFAVLQDHVTGKVFNTQPRNIALKTLFYIEWVSVCLESIEASILKLWPAFY